MRPHPHPPTEEGLPAEIPTHRTTGSVVATWLGTLCTAVLVNFLVYWAYASGAVVDPLRHKWRLLLDLDRRAEWLFIGDSSCYQSILPSRVPTMDGVALNLCTNGSVLAANDSWMLEKYLERHPPPDRVVLVHVYDIWSRDFWPRIVATIPLPWGFWQRVTPAMRPGGVERLKMAAARWLPLYVHRAHLTHLVSTMFDQARPDARGEVAAYVQRDGASVAADLHDHLAFVRGNRFHLSTPNREALQNVSRLADAYGFDVYLTSSPTHEQLLRDPSFREYFAEVAEALCDAARSSPRVHYLGDPIPVPENWLHNSVDHLTLAASAPFTDALVARVLKHRSAQCEQTASR